MVNGNGDIRRHRVGTITGAQAQEVVTGNDESRGGVCGCCVGKSDRPRATDHAPRQRQQITINVAGRAIQTHRGSHGSMFLVGMIHG